MNRLLAGMMRRVCFEQASDGTDGGAGGGAVGDGATGSGSLLGDAATATDGQQAQGAADSGNQQQAADGQQAEDGQQEQANQEQKPEGAPDKYEFQAPEGQQFDETVLGAFSEVAKELDLPQEAAQKVLDKMAPVIAARQAEQIEAARNNWAETARGDKEFGGDKLAENLGVARKAMDAFASPELRTLLNESGLGNHPEVIRMFYRTGKAISEDRVVTGGNSRSFSDAKSFYPNSNMN